MRCRLLLPAAPLAALLSAFVALLPPGQLSAQGGAAAVEAAFARFWSARSPGEAAAAVDAIVASGVSFDQAYARLKQGRTYGADVPRGIVADSLRTASGEFPFTLEVPDSYDPARRYQVRIHLHGGVSRPDPVTRGTGGIGSLAGAEQIYLLPVSWRDAPWWGEAQVESLRAILDRVRRTYNLDENRVALAGVSDGGTGLFYVAMRDTTPYASFLPLNGFLMVLANRSLAIREELYPNNLLNKPFFAVNGARDQLYPADRIEPFVRHLQRGGVDFTWDARPEAGHNTAWWPEVRDPFEAFVNSHPREPHPAKLTWETDMSPSASRAHWLVIDPTPAPPRAERLLPDLNERTVGSELNFGVRAEGMRITAVSAGSSAQTFGLLPGDLVLGIGAREVPSGVSLVDLLSIHERGARLTLTVERDGRRTELSGNFEPSVSPRTRPLFPRRGRSGRVDLVREGNTVRAETRGVAQFTLLVSPDAFDLSQPIVVVVDGRTMFDARVTPDLTTLLRWAARDNDRTMLYAAEIQVRPGA